MLDDQNELRKITLTVTEIFNADKDLEVADLLRSSEITSEPSYYDNWNGGTTYYSIYVTEEQKYNAIHRKQALLYRNSNGNLEKSFLEQFNGYGIQLYKMSQTSTQTVWNKRELNANKTAVNSTPCN